VLAAADNTIQYNKISSAHIYQLAIFTVLCLCRESEIADLPIFIFLVKFILGALRPVACALFQRCLVLNRHVTPAVKGHAHCWIFAEEPKTIIDTKYLLFL